MAGTDCDDGNATGYPGASEACDGQDNDCDDMIDEDVLSIWYLNGDKDGWGEDGSAVEACTAPTGYISVGGDCDDASAQVYPGAAETCDGLDNDCNGLGDDGVLSTFYSDADGDGYGDPAFKVEACEAPESYVMDGTDCDDTTNLSYPGASEFCDEQDNDCNGLTDDGVTTTFTGIGMGMAMGSQT